MSLSRRIFLGVVLISTLVLATLAAWPLPEVPISPWDESSGAGPVDERAVYWVGHSLMSSRDPFAHGSRNVIESTGDIAESLGLRYRAFDHTLWGSPLSLAHRGRPHAYEREEPEHAGRRAELLDHADRYDTLVMVDTVPIGAARRYEHTEYYAARFRCDHLARRPDGRTYLYEGWVNYQGLADPSSLMGVASWRWPDRMRDEQRGYTAVAARVSEGTVAPPGLLGRLTRWLPSEKVCRGREPVFVVPVATAMLALHAELSRVDHPWRFRGRTLSSEDLFANPYTGWPADWPREGVDESEVRESLSHLTLRRPEEPADDIHPSALGTYLAALVHFATLYRRTPVGAPTIEGLADVDAERLQRLVWEVVTSDERTGVRRAD